MASTAALRSRRTEIHSAFLADTAVDPACRARLRRHRTSRIARLAEAGAGWAARRFPVLAALAPVMTSPEGEIAYPGDPMCLYAALSVTVDNALRSARLGAGPDAPFTDLCPDWGRLPSTAYRLAAGPGPRPWHRSDSVPDHCVFDPRVWDRRAMAELRAMLRHRRPTMFLISTVSPGHRYALEMARLVRREVPECLIVLGGRHLDETTRYLPATGQLVLEPSGTLRVIDDGRAESVVDFVVGGEGYFALDILLRAVALTLDLDLPQDQDRSGAGVADVVAMLDLLGHAGERVPGSSLLCAVTADAVHAFPIRGQRHDLAALPSPYQGFAVRARFPVFPRPDGSAARTAHLTVSSGCPYHCDFCSEPAALIGGLRRFEQDPAGAAVARICEYVSYGAEAVFFDDSIFWSGSFPAIRAFCAALGQVRAASGPAELPAGCRPWISTNGDWERLRGLRFGCQVTADLLTTLHREPEVRQLLDGVREAGCGYVYLGIESMASAVMDGVHKNIKRTAALPWKAKVRAALERIRDAGIPVGSSVLFGLEGETKASIEETIDEVGALIDDGLLTLASPNILTYHPGTAITRAHGMRDELDYHSAEVVNHPPYTYFEEAFPGVVSRRLSEADVWHIHRATAARWGGTRLTA